MGKVMWKLFTIPKKTGIALVTFDKIKIHAGKILTNRNIVYTLIKGLTEQEDLGIMNINVPNDRGR